MDKIKETRRTEDVKWGCGCAVINNKGKLLLGKRCKEGDLPQFGFVGGSIEVGETPLEGVLREIKEESNLTPLSVDFVTSIVDGEWTDYLFVCKNFIGIPKPQEGEMSEMGFFTLEEIEGLELFPATARSLNDLKERGIIMDLPSYIKDPEDGMILKLNGEMYLYENELAGDSLDLDVYKEHKNEYLKSTKEEYDKYNQDLEDSWSRGVRLTNKEWRQAIQILSESANGKLIADKIKQDLSY